MVSNEAKPIALHHPMEPSDLDEQWSTLQKIAANYKVEIYREDQFPQNLLFPDSLTTNKSVVIIYKGDRLTQYLQWKADAKESDSENQISLFRLARRLGRLLGYTPQGINSLLSQNTTYRNLAMAGISSQTTHFYYNDLPRAVNFYRDLLSLQQVDSTLFRIGKDSFLRLHEVNEQHPEGQPKSTAIALLTDQLPQWYEAVKQLGIEIRYTYKPKEGGPHDGFVALDPEGYLLEFETFKQHPENELLMAVLGDSEKIPVSNGLSFMGSITWTYHKDVLQMQNFYEEVLGFCLVADQGWTKIYQTSDSGFVGLVDERRGMQDYAAEKAIELEWGINEFDAIDNYATKNFGRFIYSNGSFTGPEKYRYNIVKSL